MEAEIGIQTSLGYTDNINRSELGAESEELLAAVVGGQASQEGASVERSVRWEVGAIDYLGGAYDLESLGALDGAADFSLIERRLVWRFEDRLGLQSLDPFAPVTPGSREYVNFFQTGPQLTLPLSTNVALTASLSRADLWYEVQSLGNSRNGALAGVEFGVGPQRTLGVFATKQDYEFDENSLHSDYEREQFYFQYETARPRGTLRAALGINEIGGLGEPLEQPLVEVDWERTVSDYSTFAVVVQRGYFDEGDVFEFSDTVGGATGTTQPIAGVSNPLDRTAVTASFVHSKPRMSTTVSLSLRRDEYEGLEGALNRDIPMLNVRFSRGMSPRMRLEWGGYFTKQESLDTDTRDEDRRISLGLAWRAGPRMDLNFTVARSQRSSTVIGSSSKETRAFVTFSYGARISGIQLGL